MWYHVEQHYVSSDFAPQLRAISLESYLWKPHVFACAPRRGFSLCLLKVFMYRLFP
jgi:hypothetical protein